MRAYLEDLTGSVTITIKKTKRSRSLRQNAYYWLILTLLGKELGYTPEEMHDTFKAKFLYKLDHGLKIPQSTTSLDIVEFIEYLEKIIAIAIELNITLPRPDEL